MARALGRLHRVLAPVFLAALTLGSLPTRTEAADDSPKVRSLTPSNGARGTSVELAVEGQNLFPVTDVSSSVTGVVVTVIDGSTAFKLKVRMTIPDTAPAGPMALTIKTKTGTVSTDRFTIRLRAPTVSKIKPDAMKRGGEYDVTVTGAYFQMTGQETKVSVDGGMTVTKLPASNDKSLALKLLIPAATPAGPHAITIEAPDGKVTAAFNVLLSPPAVTSIKPATLPRGGEAEVKIEGTDLAGVGGVTLSVPDSTIVIRANGDPDAHAVSVKIAVAADAKPGPRTLLLASADGITTSTIVVALNPPALASVTPAGAPRGTAADIKAAGANLGADPALHVVPPDPAIHVEAGRAGGQRITIDANARPGPRTLAITTADGTAVLPFGVTLRPPTVASLLPAEVEPGSEADLQVDGLNLEGCTWSVAPEDADVAVTSGATPDKVHVAVKAGAKTGPRCLVARSDDGAAIGLFAVKGSSAASPVLAAISPSKIARPAKTVVTLTGSNLRSKGDKAPEVSVARPGATPLPVEIGASTPTSLTLTVTTDAGTAPGVFVVTVKTEDGGAALTLLVAPSPPSIAAITPDHVGRPASVDLVLTGAGLVNPDGSPPAVVIAKADGSSPLTAEVVHTQATTATADRVTVHLTLDAKAAPGGYVASVATADGGTAVPFVVEGAPPAITSIAPPRMGVPATADFVVTGSHLTNPDGKPPSIQVTRTGSASDLIPLIVASDEKTLTFRLSTRPSTAPGPHLVSIRTADGVVSALFAVVGSPPPVIDKIDAAGAARMQTLLTTIHGTGLLGATEVLFEGKGVVATILPGANDLALQVKIVVAADADLGPHAFSVSAPGGVTPSGAVLFTVK